MRLGLRKLAIPIVLAALLALQIWLYGFSVRALLGFCALLVVLVCAEGFADRVRRPWRNYLIVAAVSAFAGMLLLSLSQSVAALILWLVCTAMALCWVWYWERAEPLPPAV